MEDLYLDENGYYRFKLTKRLVHRKVAYDQKPYPLNWVVHHVNGDKLDNRSENLIALTQTIHNRIHRMFRTRGLPPKSLIEEVVRFYWANKKKKGFKKKLNHLLRDLKKSMPKPIKIKKEKKGKQLEPKKKNFKSIFLIRKGTGEERRITK